MVTVNKLPLGAPIQLGAYCHTSRYLNTPPGFRTPEQIIWRKINADNCFIADRCVDLLCFDEYERGRVEPQNTYATSNIRQFLCSDEEDWFSPQTGTDVAPRYSRRPGFLHHFSATHLAVLEEVNPDGDLVMLPWRNIFQEKAFTSRKLNKRPDGRFSGKCWDPFWLESCESIDSSGRNVGLCSSGYHCGIRPVIKIVGDAEFYLPTGSMFYELDPDFKPQSQRAAKYLLNITTEAFNLLLGIC